MQLVHHFSIQVGKGIFHRDDVGMISSASPLRSADAERFGLEAVLLYSLEVEGLPQRFIQASLRGDPLDPLQFLVSGWGEIDGLHGVPDQLKVHPEIARRLPGLRADVERLGVQWIKAEGKDKRFMAQLRQVHRDAVEDMWWFEARPDSDLSGLNASLRSSSFWRFGTDMEDGLHDAYAGRDVATSRGVLAMARNLRSSRRDMDGLRRGFEIGQAGIAPRDYADLVRGSKGAPSLLDAEQSADDWDDCTLLARLGDVRASLASEAERDGDDGEITYRELLWRMAEIARPLVACWPATPAKIASRIGVRTSDLTWFLKREKDLSRDAVWRLWNVLGLRQESYGLPEPHGPYVLVARSVKAAGAVYDDMTSGDVGLCSEIVPENAMPDPAWRYLLFWTPYDHRNASIMMIPRGGRAEDLLDPSSRLLGNLQPHVLVSKGFYRAVAGEAARAMTSPDWSPDRLRGTWATWAADLLALEALEEARERERRKRH